MSTTASDLEAWLKANPAPASDEETLALKPNVVDEATSGPHEQISQTAYVHMTKPDGSEFLAPKSNVPDYEARGYTAGADEEIEDLVAYWAAKAAEEPAAEPAAEPAPAEAPPT